MHNGVLLRPPLCEIGPKGSFYGRKALEPGKPADWVARHHGLTVIVTPHRVLPTHDH